MLTKKKLKGEDTIQYIKYMGSKTKLIPFILDGIDEVYNGGYVCDLFSGSCSLSGAIGSQIPIISNDIQEYSSIIGKSYLTNWNDGKISVENILTSAKEFHNEHYADLIDKYKYSKNPSLTEFNKIEKKNQKLIKEHFDNSWHLFTKNYSGTWWSAEQCSWIDSLRKVIEDNLNSPAYETMLSSLMYAMAYNSQGTGHYAQYRDAKNESSKKDILIYRNKSILDYFERKLTDAFKNLPLEKPTLPHQVVSQDYLECLKDIKDATIYADPPYCFVHYSRFYHALETIALYDYPNIQVKGGKMVKGRYREERHQSPFSIKSKVEGAFEDMFKIISKNNSSLVLSYSNTGMIDLQTILNSAENCFKNHHISVKSLDYLHMTMGRKKDRDRNVKELLIIIKPI